MELVLKHFRSSTMVSTQLNIALAWCQRMSGISKPILEYPSIQLPHLETSFFPSLRAYLSSTNSALILENTHVVPLQRIGDLHLILQRSKRIKISPSALILENTSITASSTVRSAFFLADLMTWKFIRNVHVLPRLGRSGERHVPSGALLTQGHCTSPSVPGRFRASPFADHGPSIGIHQQADSWSEHPMAIQPIGHSPGVQED